MILRTIRMGEGGVPVVLLHGLFGAASNWGRVQRRLAERGCVVAMDARNHGGSGHDPVVDYGTMAGDVIETLDAEGLGEVAVVGHSMGGKTGMMMALRAPERVARMVVADIAPVVYPPHFKAMAAAMVALELRPGMTRGEADAALEGAAPDPVVRAFLLQNLRFGDAPGWRIGLAEIAAGLGGVRRLGGGGGVWGAGAGVAGGAVGLCAAGASGFVPGAVSRGAVCDVAGGWALATRGCAGGFHRDGSGFLGG